MFEIEFNFQNWQKTLYLGVSKPTKRLVTQSMCDWQVKQAFFKENEKEKRKKFKYVKFEVASFIYLQSIKPATVVK